MSPKIEVGLQADIFHGDEDIEFRVTAKKEILYLLQQIAKQGTQIALHYGGQDNFIRTTLLGANNDGMWLDVGPFDPENKNIQLSEQITFVSLHQNVKIQFTSNTLQGVTLEGHEAFFMPFPPYLLRIQRRNYFRLNVPLSVPVRCFIPGTTSGTREMRVLDISGGGLGLLCNMNDPDIKEGSLFENCRISLPNVGDIKAALTVRGTFRFPMQNGSIKARAGCQFVSLDNQADNLLQRYIVRLQAEALVK